MCSGLIINNIMLQILNLSMASKKIGVPLTAFSNVSFKNLFKILANVLRRK